jgi:hypothetical protein
MTMLVQLANTVYSEPSNSCQRSALALSANVPHLLLSTEWYGFVHVMERTDKFRVMAVANVRFASSSINASTV